MDRPRPELNKVPQVMLGLCQLKCRGAQPALRP